MLINYVKNPNDTNKKFITHLKSKDYSPKNKKDTKKKQKQADQLYIDQNLLKEVKAKKKTNYAKARIDIAQEKNVVYVAREREREREREKEMKESTI